MDRLRATGVVRRYGSTAALGGVSLTLAGGEVHALIGENGAGKSTLMKVLAGAEAPDAGSMWLDGQPYRPSGPAEARRLGVAMVHQELSLAPDLTVEENVLLGAEPSVYGWLKVGKGRRLARKALQEVGQPDLPLDRPVSELGPGLRQVVEIARTCLTTLRVLVLDEPTSSLSHEDRPRLFDLVRRMRSQGAAVLYTTHHLEEAQDLADRWTVLRDGMVVASGERNAFDIRAILEAMAGRPVREAYPRIPHAVGEPVLEVLELAGPRLPVSASLCLHRGEVLGVFGLAGSGRTELLRALYGLETARSGQVRILAFSGKAPPWERITQGVGMLSEDRKGEGVSLSESIEDNLTASRIPNILGVLDLAASRRAARRWVEALGVRCYGPEQAVGQLSGGSQQKVALARLLHQDAEVLLLDEPTRGVDAASKSEVYRLIGELAAAGKAVLLVSSYLPELLGMCDRLTVMCRGCLSEARPVAEWSAEEVLAVATGAAHARAAS